MTKDEYNKIQAELSALLDKMQYKLIMGKRREGYEEAVKSCKSILSKYKPVSYQ